MSTNQSVAYPFLTTDTLRWLRTQLYLRRIHLLQRERNLHELLEGKSHIAAVEHRAEQLIGIASDLQWVSEALANIQTEILAQQRDELTSAPFKPPESPPKPALIVTTIAAAELSQDGAR